MNTHRFVDSLRTLLIEDANVTERFESRVYPLISPTTAQRPYIIYRRSTINREQSLSGPVGHPRVFVEFTVYADTYEGALDAADVVRSSLDGRSAVVGEVFIQNVWVDDESDDYVQLAGSEMPPLYSVSLVFGVIWKEI